MNNELVLSIYGKSHEILWTHLAILIFAFVFFLVGTQRIVEFNDLNLGRRGKALGILAHMTGTILFSFALGLLALDVYQSYRNLTSACFVISVFTLFPLHIYVAVRRRTQIKIQTDRKT